MTLDDRARAEILATFGVELGEHCRGLTRAFLSLEKEPEPAEHRALLDEAFRAAHSLKGAARAVGQEPIEALAHGLEDALQAARDGELELSPPLFDLLYAVVDGLEGALGEGGGPGLDPSRVADLLGQLAKLRADRRPAAAVAARPGPAGSPAPPQPDGAPDRGGAGPLRGGVETVRLPAARLDALLEQLGVLVVPRLEIVEGLAALGALRADVEHSQRGWRKVKPALRRLEREGGLGGVRPLVRFLEQNEAHMTSLAGRLGAIQARLAGPTAQLGVLTDSLQTDVKQVRMLPFGRLSQALERAARDLARAAGKEARLVVVGTDTELDRRVIEGIKDSLLHLLRNAVDHGIEAPEERRRRGKPSIGSLVVAATQRGSTVVIEVEDDGAGLDPAAIRRAAAERGLVPAADLAGMSDAEVLRLVFMPGLSTRADVGAVSGRGVGLDVVAHDVERLGGRVEAEARRGQGTRFVITLPLTLATTRALLLEAGGGLYALPTGAVERVLRPERLGSVGGRPVLEHEGVAVQVAALASLLDPRAAAAGNGLPPILALVGAGSQRVALAVDRVAGEQEIVVKPLGYPLLRVRHVAGATILGSGRVVPILHAPDLVRSAIRPDAAPPPARPAAPEPRRRRVLVADDSLTTRTLERYILEAAGYEVEVAGDGAEALALLRESGFDLLVSDVNMPELDGVALTARLRQDPKLRELPVILVTTRDSAEDRQRGLEAGADAYIVKSSFDQDQLLRTIEELL